MARTISNKVGGSGRSLLLLALLFAAIAAILVFVALNRSGNGSSASAGDTTQVVVAAHDIAARTTLDSDMLKVIDVSTDSALSGTFSETDSLVGQITRYPLAENEQVTASKVGTGSTSSNDNQGLSFVVPTGMRAFSVGVTEETGVGGMIL
ncbi:MAG: Flp pilus assembly protein CpaB, partial [Dehalococcoidia bacterium]